MMRSMLSIVSLLIEFLETSLMLMCVGCIFVSPQSEVGCTVYNAAP